MKNKIFSKSISVFLTLIFIFGLVSPMVFAQPDSQLSAEVKGFNRSVFESHFSRADREINPERWLFEAKLGVTQALCAWEMVACGLYENPLLFEEDKRKVEKWSNEELEERFVKWLTGRFFGEAAEKALIKISSMFGETQKNYSWHLDDEGNVIFDDKTGDPLIIRPGDDREFSRDLLMWRDDADNHVKTNTASFDIVMAGLYTELLAYIPEELRETMISVIGETSVNVGGSIKREFENIAAREERIFTSRRTRDILSLRKKNDDEAARLFTQKLIAETEEVCARGIENLNMKIEQASAGTGDLALLGDEWLRLYREQFDRGLKAWEEAEERFFVKRIEWEQESYKLFSQGEEMWLAAFGQFEEERKKWELKAKDLFEYGETMFKNISEEFSKNITDAKKEFETNMTMRIGEGTAKVKALIDMYLICASAAISAMENVQYWYSQYNKLGKKDPKDPDFYAWLLQEQAKTKNSSLTEIVKSYEMYLSYMEKARDARDRILANYAELLGTGALKDILSPDASSEDFCLDEYQIALVRAKALVIYWERKTAINEAVMNYANEFSAGRMTEAEGLRVWENAKASYNESLAAYDAELKKLNAIGEDIQKQQAILNNLSQKLLQEEEKLNKMNLEYTALVGVSIVNSSSFYLIELNAKYDFLVNEYKFLLQSGTDAEYKNILEYGMRWDSIERRESAEGALDILTNGYGTQIPSLTDLKNNVLRGTASETDLRIRLAAIDLFADDSGVLRLLDSTYSGADWYSKAKGINLTTEEKDALYGEKLYVRLVTDYKNSYQILLEKQAELTPVDLEKFYNEYYLCLGLLEIYEEYAAINSFTRDEYWKDTCNSLKMLFEDLSINQAFGSLPDVKEICDAIYRKQGDFLQNTSQFLFDFEKCFYLIPQWLEFEINNWKSATIEYIAAYAFFTGYDADNLADTLSGKKQEIEARYNEIYAYANSMEEIDDNEAEKLNNALAKINNDIAVLYCTEQIYQVLETYKDASVSTGKDKHWRQYLSENYIDNYDPLFEMASTREEGILADALFNAAYFTNRINDTFAVFIQKDTGYAIGDALQFYELFTEEASQSIYLLNSMKVIFDEIANAGRTYEYSKMIPTDVSVQLKNSREELTIQENIFNVLRNEYFMEADKFLNTGLRYDEQYGILKKAYDNSELRRFEYEKQDAIQRWASTAYLNTDHIDTEDCNVKLTNARTVLAVLSDIYNGESRRSWDNPEYNSIYAEYEQSFGRKIKIMEAYELLLIETAREKANNEKIYKEYQSLLNKLGFVDTNYSNYVSSAQRSKWTLKDIITVKNGRLVFSRDSSMRLTGVDASKAEALDSFFNTTISLNGERFDISLFEESLRGLSQRMSGYFQDSNKFMQWSFARDYLITSLINSNRDLSFLNNYYSGLGQMNEYGSLGSLMVKESLFGKPQKLYSASNISGYNASFKNTLNLFWETLSEEEKTDLEYYVILTLSGGSLEYYYGFSQVYTLNVYTHAYDHVNERYNYAKDQYNSWWKSVGIGLLLPGAGTVRTLMYKEMKNVNYSALKRVDPVLKRTKSQVNAWISGLQNNISSIKSKASAYTASCKRLDALEGKAASGGSIDWNIISLALSTVNKISETDITKIKIHWFDMQSETGLEFTNVQEALASLLVWAKNKEDKNKIAFENIWLNDAQKQQTNNSNFQIASEAYIAGKLDIESLKLAAENAYGKNAAAWKNHFENVHTVLYNDLSIYLNINLNFFNEFRIPGEELAAITEKILRNRYSAELSTRETEWNLQMRDIMEKYNEWLDSAALIFENGRTDWNISVKKMEVSYKQWKVNFQNEYSRVSDEWAEAYLAGLEDKEKWLEQAASAANQASAESFLLLVGTEGERLSRFLDTREPFGIRNALPETKTLMAELLNSSGIANMYRAFGSINNITETASYLIRRGIGGISTWDAAIIKTAASDMARKTNAEIAERETRKLAHIARLSADEAIKNLMDSVDVTNNNFRENMDNIFIMDGNWRKTGNSYIKDIVKGSTLFTPVVSETVTLAGYRNYRVNPLSLKTNLDENYLAGLDTIAIRGLIENVFIEIKIIGEEIFGTADDKNLVIKRTYFKSREQSPGKFGAHIGYEPAARPAEEFGSSRNSLFYDEGAGELGRLLSDYIYWSVIDSKGSGEISLAPWDKRIWNDENSFFSAPSLRSVGQIATTVAAVIVAGAATPFTGGASAIGLVALGVAINSSDDLLYASLDAGYGYKSIGEAGFDFGKSLLINTAGAMIGGAFNGFGSFGGEVLSKGLTWTAVSAASTTAGKVMVQTAMTGLQTAATTLTTSALNSVTYNSTDGFGWSNDIFKAGMNGMLTSTLSSMVNSFTSGTLQAINSGMSMEKLEGFNNTKNKPDIMKLNSLAGSFAGQGVNYAMGGDFTLNVLNLSMMTGGSFNSGLLELHLGRDGASMSLGTGGANVSFDNLQAVLRGTQVWNVSNRINGFVRKNDNIFDTSFLRAQYGFGDNVQKGQLWDILNGDVRIMTNPEGDFSAETIIVNGQRVINLSGYHTGMNMEDQMRLAVILGHEAYRDGIVTDDNYLETRSTAAAHTEMALRMLMDGQNFNIDDNLLRDLIAYSYGSDFFNSYVDNYYDSNADYWKLTREGDLEYDGFATLRDTDGNIIKTYKQMGLSNDNSIEGALLWLLNINPKDAASVSEVRNMMVMSGLRHSFGNDPNNWFWRGEQTVMTGNKGSFPITGIVDLTEANMGKTISINSIAKLFTNMGTSGTEINTSINRIYGSAVGFLLYADTGSNKNIASSMLSVYYSEVQMSMLNANFSFIKNGLSKGINIGVMVVGNVKRTEEFGNDTGDLKLKSSSVENAKFFRELHTGIDYGSGGTSVLVPGGYWELIKADDHKAYYQLYGSDVKMRVQHLNPEELKKLALNTIFGGNDKKLMDYPTKSYGSGTGAHIHIDMTMNLPYDGSYTRQFVNPETLRPGSRLEYPYAYMDANKNNIKGNSGNFWRY
jgi:hypothetical protein